LKVLALSTLHLISYALYIRGVRQELNMPTTYEDVEDLAEMLKAFRREATRISEERIQNKSATQRVKRQLKRILISFGPQNRAHPLAEDKVAIVGDGTGNPTAQIPN
jgi:hypothetical protein